MDPYFASFLLGMLAGHAFNIMIMLFYMWKERRK